MKKIVLPLFLRPFSHIAAWQVMASISIIPYWRIRHRTGLFVLSNDAVIHPQPAIGARLMGQNLFDIAYPSMIPLSLGVTELRHPLKKAAPIVPSPSVEKAG